MSGFALGLKALRRFCEEQSPLAWYKGKLVEGMFKPVEREAFKWVDNFVRTHHAMPQLATLEQKFPEMKEVQAVEPSSYYLKHLETRFFYEKISDANLKSQDTLKTNPEDIDAALLVMKQAMGEISRQRYRTRIVDVGMEGPQMVLTAYHNTLLVENVSTFGWPYMDNMTGGVMGGDVVSFVGRPASGKTFKVLRTAIHNWRRGNKVLVVSMEMAPLPIVQRIAAMYAHTNLTQLKLGSYSTFKVGGASSSYKKFEDGLLGMATEKSKLYVVDGNLAATMDDIYELAAQLDVDEVYIDGAYLVRHKNPRLGRYEKVAENVELMKQNTTTLEIPTWASWQFNREASKNKEKAKGDGGLEDIAYSDAIGQTSSVVLGLYQEDTVETLYQRKVKVLKGRNGEIGEFTIHWDFANMNFDQVLETAEEAKPELEFL